MALSDERLAELAKHLQKNRKISTGDNVLENWHGSAEKKRLLGLNEKYRAQYAYTAAPTVARTIKRINSVWPLIPGKHPSLVESIRCAKAELIDNQNKVEAGLFDKTIEVADSVDLKRLLNKTVRFEDTLAEIVDANGRVASRQLQLCADLEFWLEEYDRLEGARVATYVNATPRPPMEPADDFHTGNEIKIVSNYRDR